MSAENKALARRWFEEVWNQGRAPAIDEMLASNAVVHGLGPHSETPAEFKQFHAAYRDAFPDVQIRIDAVIAEGNLVAVRWSGGATHPGRRPWVSGNSEARRLHRHDAVACGKREAGRRLEQLRPAWPFAAARRRSNALSPAISLARVLLLEVMAGFGRPSPAECNMSYGLISAGASIVLASTMAFAPLSPAKAPAPTQAAEASATPVLDLQILLDRAGFSPGEIDGRGGSNTSHAVWRFRRLVACLPARAMPTSSRHSEEGRSKLW